MGNRFARKPSAMPSIAFTGRNRFLDGRFVRKIGPHEYVAKSRFALRAFLEIAAGQFRRRSASTADHKIAKEPASLFRRE